ncbi:MAG TPA: alpha/beta hydrolase family protein [Candidatus Angelobacter sp.]|jgi:putative tributyrin esterase|nr:alpha/beta hydrolase family protein [Candidatus Angelobacter sp.]
MAEGLAGHTIFSLANRRRLEHWTWMPPGHPGRDLPVVVLLHGVRDAGGFVWWEKGAADRTAARLVAAGELPPFCLVMAGDTGAELGSGYCDWVDGTTAAETYLVGELLPWIDAELPVPSDRHVAGLSMGGYGALLLALRNPGTFDSASATSGFFDPQRLFQYVPDARRRMWGDDDALMAAHDITSLVSDPARRTGLRLALDCGTEDPLLDASRGFHAHLDRLGVAHGYVERPGGHDWGYWRGRLADHLRFHLGAHGDLAAPALAGSEVTRT